MDELNIGQQSSALALLHCMAAEIAAIERLASQTPDWTTARHLGTLAEGFRDLLDFFTQVPGVMDEAVPWQPKGFASSK
jgi:hypothetical protein